jgi:hypothetical protein
MNLPNIQQLHYCQKKTGHTGTCSNIATRQVKLKTKKNKESPTAETEWQYRCEEHALTATSGKCVIESNLLDQSYALTKINEYLKTLIGKNIISKWHNVRELRVKYLKPNTGGVMCFEEYSKQWKFVYYNQITEVL